MRVMDEMKGDGRIKRKHNMDTDGTKGDGEGQNSREEHNRRVGNSTGL